MRRLNREWMESDSVTDVLSFPSDDPPPGTAEEEATLGEVLICVPVCEKEARRRAIPLSDEIARMLIHGTLHLLGYDHGTKAQKRRMRSREKRYLAWVRRHRLRLVEER
jgi:probable rRNA maturation factor